MQHCKLVNEMTEKLLLGGMHRECADETGNAPATTVKSTKDQAQDGDTAKSQGKGKGRIDEEAETNKEKYFRLKREDPVPGGTFAVQVDANNVWTYQGKKLVYADPATHKKPTLTDLAWCLGQFERSVVGSYWLEKDPGWI